MSNSSVTRSDGKLSLATKLVYGAGDVGNALVNSSVQFFLLIFYTDAAHIPPALASSALLLAKLWDAVNDPIFGWISDRTRSRFGKRRVYMLFGAVPLGISVGLLWFIPSGLSNAWLFVWILSTFIVWDTLWTLTNVPYYALTAELTDDYDERSSLTATRMVLSVPAYILGAALTPALVGLFATQKAGYSVMGIIYGAISAATLLFSGGLLRERRHIVESQSAIPPVRALLITLRNGPFVRLIIAYMVASMAFMMTKTLLAYYLIYHLGMEKQVPIVMLLMLGSVTIFLVPWKKVSERANKGPSYALGLAIGGAAVTSAFFLPKGPTALVYGIAVLAGIGFATNWVFPWAMVPDVAEFDRAETGEYRGGMYYGVWGLGQKFSEGLGLSLSGWVLQMFGYVANARQTDSALFGIRLFFGPVPAVLFLTILPLLIWYPITRKTHAEIRAKLDGLPAEPEPDLSEEGAPALA